MIRFPTTGARPLARESLLALAAALWLAVPRAAGAADPDAPPDDAAPEISLVERQHQRISGALEAMLRRTDTLFGGDRNYDLPTGSYVRLGARGTFYRPDDRGNDLSGILSAKLRLPLQPHNNLPSIFRSPFVP